MTGPKSYKERKTEQERGKKRFLERLVEEQEAKEEIKEYEDSRDEGDPNRFNGDGPKYRQRSEGKFP